MTKKIILQLLFWLLGALSAEAQRVKHVVLISIDAFRPDFYLDNTWPAPTIQAMKDRGVYAREVTPVFPSITYPNHMTLITGVRPAEHGIYFNSAFAPKAGGTSGIAWTADSIRAPTLFDLVKQHQGSTVAVLWPVIGKNVDYNIPWDRQRAYKRDVLEKTHRYSTPWEELDRYEEVNLVKMDLDTATVDDELARLTAYLVGKHRPTFTAIHFLALDHAQHQYGRDGVEVRYALANIDKGVQTILRAIDAAGIADSTAVIVTGDHGFTTVRQAFYPNVLLQQAGLIGDLRKDEWKAMFHADGGAMFLYLKRPNDLTTLDKVRKVLDKLPPEQRSLFRVLEKKELTALAAAPNSPLALDAQQDLLMSSAIPAGKEAFQPFQGGTHGYLPSFKEIKTGFIGLGAGFSKGGRSVDVMKEEDVASIISYLFGWSFPSGHGTVPKEFLDGGQ